MGGSFNYLIDPRIYYSSTHLDFSVSIFLYNTFAVLYPHRQHTHATSVEVFVNIRCFKKRRLFICAISGPLLDKNNDHTTHTVSRSPIIFQAEIRINVFMMTITIQYTNEYVFQLTRIGRVSVRNVDLPYCSCRMLWVWDDGGSNRSPRPQFNSSASAGTAGTDRFISNGALFPFLAPCF